MKASYKPTQRTITNTKTAASKTPIVSVEITSALWDKMLLEGYAQYLSTTSPLVSGAVVFWESGNNATSVAGANAITFTDTNGYYAVTLKAGMGYKVKLYS